MTEFNIPTEHMAIVIDALKGALVAVDFHATMAGEEDGTVVGVIQERTATDLIVKRIEPPLDEHDTGLSYIGLDAIDCITMIGLPIEASIPNGSLDGIVLKIPVLYDVMDDLGEPYEDDRIEEIQAPTEEMLGLVPVTLQMALRDAGLKRDAGPTAALLVGWWLLMEHADGRPLGERHGWAVRYVWHLLTGGKPHRNDPEPKPKPLIEVLAEPERQDWYYVQRWYESERGWGTRPDGWSLHRNGADCAAFIRDYTKNRNPLHVPDVYDRPVGGYYIASGSALTDDQVRAVHASPYGVRYFDNNLPKKG